MFPYWLLFFPSTSRKPSTSCCFIGISLAPTRQKKCLLDGALGYSWYNNKLVAIHKIPTVMWGNSLYWPPSKVLAQLWVGKCLSTSNLFWWCRSQRIYHSNQSQENKIGPGLHSCFAWNMAAKQKLRIHRWRLRRLAEFVPTHSTHFSK